MQLEMWSIQKHNTDTVICLGKNSWITIYVPSIIKLICKMYLTRELCCAGHHKREKQNTRNWPDIDRNMYAVRQATTLVRSKETEALNWERLQTPLLKQMNISAFFEVCILLLSAAKIIINQCRILCSSSFFYLFFLSAVGRIYRYVSAFNVFATFAFAIFNPFVVRSESKPSNSRIGIITTKNDFSKRNFVLPIKI